MRNKITRKAKERAIAGERPAPTVLEIVRKQPSVFLRKIPQRSLIEELLTTFFILKFGRKKNGKSQEIVSAAGVKPYRNLVR